MLSPKDFVDLGVLRRQDVNRPDVVARLFEGQTTNVCCKLLPQIDAEFSAAAEFLRVSKAAVLTQGVLVMVEMVREAAGRQGVLEELNALRKEAYIERGGSWNDGDGGGFGSWGEDREAALLELEQQAEAERSAADRAEEAWRGRHV